jgi:hypothetical protein
MSINNNNKDTHIYNIINNPSKEFTEPCEFCGVSEFQLGVKHTEERIIKLLKERFAENVDRCEWGTHLFLDNAIELIKGETK